MQEPNNKDRNLEYLKGVASGQFGPLSIPFPFPPPQSTLSLQQVNPALLAVAPPTRDARITITISYRTTTPRSSSSTYYLTNRFHVAMHLFSNRSQKTSK